MVAAVVKKLDYSNCETERITVKKMAIFQFAHPEKFDFTKPQTGRSGFSALKDSGQLQECQKNLRRYKLIL